LHLSRSGHFHYRLGKRERFVALIILAIPVIVWAIVREWYGFLLSLLAGFTTFIVEIAFLYRIGTRSQRTKARALQVAAAPPLEHNPFEWHTVPRRETVERARRALPRDSDRYLPVDELPRPLGAWQSDAEQGTAVRLPGTIGEAVCFERISSFELEKNADNEELKAHLHRQLYDGFKLAISRHVDIETGLDGSPAAMINPDELPESFRTNEGSSSCATPLIAFRSRDAQWGGFRYAGESFRFPLKHLKGVVLEVSLPLRFSGSYSVSVVLDSPNRCKGNISSPFSYEFATRFDLDLPYSESWSFSLLTGLGILEPLFDIRVRCNVQSDD
jgi:hypothetical protein